MIRMHHLTSDFLTANVISRTNPLGSDLAAPQIALVQPSGDLTLDEFTPCDWVDASTPVMTADGATVDHYIRSFRLFIGPDSERGQLAVGDYRIFVRFVANPARIIEGFDTLRIE
jgi:hypothetical protein